jgi:hypothetical protein
MPSTAPPPLDRVDPGQAWLRWRPTAADPWDLKWAGHLYRWAAFGASLPELHAAVRAGQPATLDRLLRGEPGTEGRDRVVAAAGDNIARRGDPAALRSWWLYVMRHGGHPLREKLTLFWHNHFATSVAKVQRPVPMFNQNQLLRRHALGRFRPLLVDISHDPAMLVWLDSDSNVKGRPNENYARELMELFTLGVGNYTERDVREAARAFTGWHVEGDEFAFDADEHDDGVKTVLGRAGNWGGDDVVGILLGRPAAARFLVRKLYRLFISEAASPPDALLEPLADSFRKSDYDIGALVKTLLGSRHFHSAHAYRQRIKDPVEFVLGAVQALWDGPVAPTTFVPELEAIGQALFAPPNVKGWPGGRSWLNTATVVARHRFAQGLASGTIQVATTAGGSLGAGLAAITGAGIGVASGAAKPPEAPRPPPPTQDPAAVVRREKLTAPDRVVDLLVDLLLQGGISAGARGKLIAYLAEGKPAGEALYQRVREVAHAVMTMPEYQLA